MHILCFQYTDNASFLYKKKQKLEKIGMRQIWWIFGDSGGGINFSFNHLLFCIFILLGISGLPSFFLNFVFLLPFFSSFFRACHFMFPGGNESSLRQTNSAGRPDTFNGCQKCCHGNVCCKMAAYETETHVLKDSGIDTGHSSSSQTLNEDSSKVPPKTYLANISTSFLSCGTPLFYIGMHCQGFDTSNITCCHK